MSASLHNSPTDDTTCCGCLHFPIFTKTRRITENPPNQQKEASFALRQQPTDHTTKNVESRETGGGNDPGIANIPPIVAEPTTNLGKGDPKNAEAGGCVAPVPVIPIEATTAAIQHPTIPMFQGASNFQIRDTTINAIVGDATFIRFGDGEFTEIQRNLIGDYIAKHIVLPVIDDNLKKHILTQFIILLPRAEAVFNDYKTKKKTGPCFNGTRVSLLRDMADWVTGQDESSMYVLSGLAGIGKSTVAYTIASRTADLNLLGASFFFSRDDADRNNAKKFFTTIAYQLCTYDESFAKAIGGMLGTEYGSAAITKDPRNQLEILILEPLRSIVQSRVRPILVVVDALDECDEDDVHAVVDCLSRLVLDLPSFKVILTTRPHSSFDYFLRNKGIQKLLHLQDIEDKVVDGDIRHYLKHHLSLEKVQDRFPKWRWCANDEQIAALVHAAGRLFIIASTSVRYILDKSASNPAAQMQKLLRACAQDHIPFTDLDQFYTVILRNVVPENSDDDLISRYQSVVGAIGLIHRPLPISALSHLIGINVLDVHAVLDNLQSVILLGDDDIPRIYHQSFSDYIMDCKDPRLRIDSRVGHTQIAKRCFDILNGHLRYNILGLGTPDVYMNNEVAIEKGMITDVQIQEKIPKQLRYACVFWAIHFGAADTQDTDLVNGLAKFVDEHLLHWFEVLSLIGNLDSAHRAISVSLKLPLTPSDLHQLLSDALRFISKFYKIINRSALHTYHSALSFSPTYSLLHRRYIKEPTYNVFRIEGGLAQWDPLVTSLGFRKGEVGFVKMSLDGTLLATYPSEYSLDYLRKQGKLSILDAITGTPISAIQGSRFAVANDFSILASSSGNNITCYNPNGSPTGAVFTAPLKIQRLSLSSQTSRVAAALSDGTVWLWKSRDADLISTFDGYEGNEYRNDLRFSPSGTRLAYSSVNGIIKIQDGISGRFVADLQCGSNNEFEFSANGSRVASLSMSCGLALWNTENGGLVGVVSSCNDCYALAISASGSLLATADNKKVTLWNESSDHLVQFNALETNTINVMTFSPNNTLVIGTENGIHLYHIEAHSIATHITLPFFWSHNALALSPDCTRLASANRFGDVHLWNIRDIDVSGPPSPQAPSITAIALSRDSSQLVCGFYDGAVELWGTDPTMQRIAYHEGQRDQITALEFGHDDRLFVSGSDNGTIRLWNGRDGSLHEAFNGSIGLEAVGLSRSILVMGGNGNVTLWDLDTLILIHTIRIAGETAYNLSISSDSDLVTFDHAPGSNFVNRYVSVFDVANRTIIATFKASGPTDIIYKLTILPDKSHLVAQLHSGNFLSFSLTNKCITEGLTLGHFTQLPDILLWHGVPVWCCSVEYGRTQLLGLFPQHESPIPVLRIPGDIVVRSWAQGSSMIALGCRDGRIMLIRPPICDID